MYVCNPSLFVVSTKFLYLCHTNLCTYKYICTYIHIYGCMDGCMHVCTYICCCMHMYVHMYVCMYVCTYVYVPMYVSMKLLIVVQRVVWNYWPRYIELRLTHEVPAARRSHCPIFTGLPVIKSVPCPAATS